MVELETEGGHPASYFELKPVRLSQQTIHVAKYPQPYSLLEFPANLYPSVHCCPRRLRCGDSLNFESWHYLPPCCVVFEQIHLQWAVY
eukprot:scaffold1912_cov167-Amphora_coffeaeformis.AAC.3